MKPMRRQTSRERRILRSSLWNALAAPHLSFETMERVVDDAATPAERITASAHAVFCRMCREELEDLRRMATRT